MTTNRRATTRKGGERQAAARPRRSAAADPADDADLAGDEVAGTEAGARNENVQSLDRGLAVIRAFGPGRVHLTLSDVARESGLTRASARRFLITLVNLGYVRVDGRVFSLRPSVLELGYAYLSGLGMPEIAAPHLEELVAKVRESSSIAVLDGQHIVYVARVPTERIMRISVSVGTRFPAYATSMGRVLLAALKPEELEQYLRDAAFDPITSSTLTDPDVLRATVKEIGRQGFAIVDEELEEGLRSVSVPIRGASGNVIAAANIAAHASRVSMTALRDELLPALLETASRIEADLWSQGVN